MSYQRLLILTGMPRSGTSWISMVLDSSPQVRYRQSPLFSYEFKNRCDEHSSREQWEELFDAVYRSRNDFMDQTFRRAAGEYPTFEQKEADPPVLLLKFDRFQNLVERLLDLFPTAKGVAVIRHPCGAIHSWLTAPKEFPPTADPLLHWRSGAAKKVAYGDHYGFDDWKRLAREHLRLQRERPQRFRVHRYEETVRDPIAQTVALFGFCGLEATEQTYRFLAESRSRHHPGVYSVYKDPAVADRWRRELRPEIRTTILDELAGTDLETLLD